MTKEQEIQKNMKLLGISREEAEQLYADDHSSQVLDSVKEIEKKVSRRYERSTVENKKTARERKIDNNKLDIMQVLVDTLQDLGYADAELEKELYIHFNNGEYTLKLTRHRKKGE